MPVVRESSKIWVSFCNSFDDDVTEFQWRAWALSYFHSVIGRGCAKYDGSELEIWAFHWNVARSCLFAFLYFLRRIVHRLIFLSVHPHVSALQHWTDFPLIYRIGCWNFNLDIFQTLFLLFHSPPKYIPAKSLVFPKSFGFGPHFLLPIATMRLKSICLCSLMFSWRFIFFVFYLLYLSNFVTYQKFPFISFVKDNSARCIDL